MTAWDKIKKLGVCDGVNSLDDYNSQVAFNTARAHKILIDEPIVNPTLEQIQALHFEIFKDVHPWAGEIRKPGNLVTMGGIVACEPQRIKIELGYASSSN
jgi:fido (protein-threonine AMPylation protein)